MRDPRKLNRLASVAILPILVLTIVLLNRAVDRPDEPGEPPVAGEMVVASLRDELLAFYRFEGERIVESRLALPGPPHELVAVNGRLYVTLGRANRLVEIEPGAPGILRTLHLDGEPHGLDHADGRLYVTLDRGHSLVAIDLASFEVVARYDTGDTPHAVAIADGIAYVTDSRDGALRAIDLASGGATTLATGAMPESVAVVGDLVAVANAHDGTLAVVSRESLSLARRFAVGAGPTRVVLLAGDSVAVALNGSDEVVVVDPGEDEVRRRLDVPPRPDGLCLSPDGAHLAVAANGADAAMIIDTAIWRPALTLRVPAGPGSCLWLP
ncbi:MAG: hypothetical protein Kow0010_09180 [Dehalococcoidia bacterium]